MEMCCLYTHHRASPCGLRKSTFCLSSVLTKEHLKPVGRLKKVCNDSVMVWTFKYDSAHSFNTDRQMVSLLQLVAGGFIR